MEAITYPDLLSYVPAHLARLDKMLEHWSYLTPIGLVGMHLIILVFGYSSMPTVDEFDYTFDRLAEVMAGFVDAIGLTAIVFT
ncbi:hypothetical protein [Nostoc sp. 'Peltigera malacea cyanobiont' DB3992]|uniref:hypothetical protein n=1 Tax=Nostoc sp. 'Peltigera malacea cyanobiont' DB3992 TaxID=1206980 RepID=UPI00211E5CEB|nr:hypothetical protein [Nostoc sp. 'Peltigera malacea cyanobiont' DB3992]